MDMKLKGREPQLGTIKRVRKIESLLYKQYPDAAVALHFENPLQLLISVILSAQCTDARVNMVTPALFKKYRTADSFARANPSELEEAIHSTGFFRNKAKNIINCCKLIMEKHGGEVPASMDELIALPGVGRKTANCVLSVAFHITSGIIVDTHVARLSNRLGLTEASNPEKIESELCELIDKKNWVHFGNALILHGRRICGARKPQCGVCFLNAVCPSSVV
jgi:endonuclease III